MDDEESSERDSSFPPLEVKFLRQDLITDVEGFEPIRHLLGVSLDANEINLSVAGETHSQGSEVMVKNGKSWLPGVVRDYDTSSGTYSIEVKQNKKLKTRTFAAEDVRGVGSSTTAI